MSDAIAPYTRLMVVGLAIGMIPTLSYGQPNDQTVVDPASAITFRLDRNQALPGNPVALLQETETTAELLATEAEKPKCPFSLTIEYTLISDFILRGINYSEFQGEGHEDPNHQMTVSIGYSLGRWGSVGFDTWFEWYAGQDEINRRNGGDNLQEVDYVIYWSYDLEPLAAGLTIGWTYILYPNTARSLRTDTSKANNNNDRTHEWWFSLEHNDAWLWKWLWPNNEEGLLNPSFFLAHDVGGIGSGNAIWMEVGLSHEFAVMENLTITPSWTLGVDHDYYRRFAVLGTPHKNTMRLGNMLWGLDVTYDMTSLLGIPDGWGSVSLSGLLFFSDALGNAEDNGIIQDEFFGGFSVAYSFGG